MQAESVRTGAEGVDIVLRDGSTVHVRPIRADDVVAVRAFLAGLSEESLSMRFFSAGISVDRAAQAALEPGGGVSLVVVTGADGRVVGHGTYVPVARGRAEVAFAIADAWQAHGIGTILLAHLADAAAAAGIDTCTASVLPVNHRMIGVFRDSGYPVELRSGFDEIVVSLPTSLSDEGRRRFEERERAAARAAAAHVLRPASIAVVGASRRRGTVGGELLHNLLAGGNGGALYAVYPRAGVVQGVLAFASVADLPEPVGLAVIAVPAAAVVDLAKACAARGARADRAVGRFRGARRARCAPPARAARGLSLGGHALARAQLPGGAQHRDRSQRDVRARYPAARARGVRVAERGAEDRGARAGGRALDRAVLVRVARGSSRSLE